MISKVVVAAGALSSVLIISGDCLSIFGLLLWAGVMILFVLGTCLPLLVQWATRNPIARETKSIVALAALAMVVPIAVNAFQKYPNIGRCVG